MRGARRGQLLPIVGVLTLILAIGALMLRSVMRQQHLDAHRFAHGEIAQQLAESGLNLGAEHLREGLLAVGSDLHALVVGRRPEGLEGVGFPVASPHMQAALELLGPDASLSLRLELRNFRPLLAGPMGGVVADPREKIGEVALVARAAYRGVPRTLVAARQVRVIQTTAPVLSKFTLFVRERGAEDPNLLAYSRLAPHEGFRYQGEPARPLVLYHRPERFPGIVDGRLHPMAEEFGPYQADRAGLVYLGGREPWALNLVHGVGAGRYEELFQLRRTRYLRGSDLPGVETEVDLFFGFYEGLLASERFGSSGAPAGLSDRTSALHLYGDVENLSPAAVLGPAFRRYVALTLLDGYWYPTRSPAEFAGAPGLEVFGGDYATYRRVMTRVVTEPYNRGVDFMVTNFEGHDPEGVLGTGATPARPGPELATRPHPRLRPAVPGDEMFLYPEPGADAPGACSLVRPMADGAEEEVFRGALADLDGALLEKLLAPKVVEEVEDQAAFEARYLRGRTLELPGVVRVRRGDLSLGRVNTGQGGMVLAPGNVTVTGRIVQTVPGRPLTLVSLEGDLRVETGSPVDVALVGLRGRFTSRGGLDLVGAVAARELDLPGLVRGEEPKAITYDRGLDPTDEESYWAQLVPVVEPKLRVYAP